jgi:glycosyltransferase involved in cell wall biosynthesis
MNAIHNAWVIENEAWTQARPRLSVLIPFLRDDPSQLLEVLDRQVAALAEVEIVTLDDGSDDNALADRVADAVRSMARPARFVRLTVNEGRSKGRNRLASHARARHLLFLDADMLPDGEDFLRRYLDLIQSDDPAVAFGGFSVDQAPRRREHALHRAMAAKSDCLPAVKRRLQPEKTVFTSNLLIRRDVFESEAFDESFKGWGWEDVEWAMRVARRHAIVHVDNTATHMGLDTAPALIAKYQQSVANFGRLAQKHPDIVAVYPSFKWARRLSRLPLRRALRATLRTLIVSDRAPLELRALCLRLYRAALYAEAM